MSSHWRASIAACLLCLLIGEHLQIGRGLRLSYTPKGSRRGDHTTWTKGAGGKGFKKNNLAALYGPETSAQIRGDLPHDNGVETKMEAVTF